MVCVWEIGGFMAFTIDNNGNITMIQGDSGSLVITGLDSKENYKVFFAIQDKTRKAVGNELIVNSNKSNSVIFELTSEYTDLMTVPKNENFAIYYYGIKICDNDGFEDTLLLGNSKLGELNTITVFPKKVEGI